MSVIVIKIADLHDLLCDIVGEINVCFAFQVKFLEFKSGKVQKFFFLQIMMCFASCFLFNVFSLFGLYRIIVRDDTSSIIETTIQLSANSYYFSLCLIVMTFCSLLTRSGKYSAVLCHKAINYSNDDSIIEHVRKRFVHKERHDSGWNGS